MRESCEGEHYLGGLVARHSASIGGGCQGNHVVQGVGSPPIISGQVPGDSDTIRSNGGKVQVHWSTRRGCGGRGYVNEMACILAYHSIPVYI